MNPDIEFRPDTWQSAGERYQRAGEALSRAVAQHLSALSVDAVGCTRGAHLVDAALSLVLPPVLEAFTEVAAERGENMQEVGRAMIDTAADYRSTEAHAAEAASSLEGLN